MTRGRSITTPTANRLVTTQSIPIQTSHSDEEEEEGPIYSTKKSSILHWSKKSKPSTKPKEKKGKEWNIEEDKKKIRKKFSHFTKENLDSLLLEYEKDPERTRLMFKLDEGSDCIIL